MNGFNISLDPKNLINQNTEVGSINKTTIQQQNYARIDNANFSFRDGQLLARLNALDHGI